MICINSRCNVAVLATRGENIFVSEMGLMFSQINLRELDDSATPLSSDEAQAGNKDICWQRRDMANEYVEETDGISIAYRN